MINNIDKTIKEIESFFTGHGSEERIVNIETYKYKSVAKCWIQDDQGKTVTKDIPYTNFIFVRDWNKLGYKLYGGDQYEIDKNIAKYNITIQKLRTDNHPRLNDGYVYLVKSSKSYNSIYSFFKDGGIDFWNLKGDKSTSMTSAPKLEEQFFISTGNRLFKGIDYYSQLNKFTFDIETTGINPNNNRVFAIGIRNNYGLEHVIEVDKVDDDQAEIKLIVLIFAAIVKLKPVIICGYNSESFDFNFLLERLKLLNFDINKLNTTYDESGVEKIKRIPNSNVKFGNSSEKYTATKIWGASVIDIIHAVKKAQAINTEIKSVSLKDICKYSKIAKSDRMYVKGDEIYEIWNQNNVYTIDYSTNTYNKIPTHLQEYANRLFLDQKYDKDTDKFIISKEVKESVFSESKELLELCVKRSKEYTKFKFTTGKEIVRRYLLDDLWETEKVDEKFNQSSFLLAKIVPTSYQRICTMGSAAVWNLLMTTWSYENMLAIPIPDKKERFSGGLARCFRKGYSKNIIKLDFASLYPSLQLTYDIFPTVDITGVLKKMLTYLSVERNKYKKLAKKAKVDNDEMLEKEFDAKQQPLKVLNNSMFGALGSNVAFNWGENSAAYRITATGRIHLRKLVDWFMKRGCDPLMAVTDGVNFSYPDTTKVDMDLNPLPEETPIDVAWQYNGKTGVSALVEKYNDEEMVKPYMKIDDDGRWTSSLNIARINYANLTPEGKIKVTGNTIKSKVMPGYIEEFINNGLKLILEGNGVGFVNYYYSYIEDLYYKRIPLLKIATKKKYKNTIQEYINRGVNKKGQQKNKMAHMELIIEQRNQMMINQYISMGNDPTLVTFDEIKAVTETLIPPEPQIGTTLYYVNTGYKKAHGDSQLIIDENTKKERIAARLISQKDIEENPNIVGDYNVVKYIDNFNKRVKTLLEGFNPKVRNSIIVKNPEYREHFTDSELELSSFPNDSIEETMHLEEMEINYWNRSGLNPYKIFDGIKIPEDYPLYLSLYDEKLSSINKIMASKNLPLVKSINDTINDGDLFMYKNENVYDLYQKTGESITIRKSNITIEETETEKIINEKIKLMRTPINIGEPHDFHITKLMKKEEIDNLEDWSKKFKKKFKIDPKTKLSTINTNDGRSGVEILYDWIEMETEAEKLREEDSDGEFDE